MGDEEVGKGRQLTQGGAQPGLGESADFTTLQTLLFVFISKRAHTPLLASIRVTGLNYPALYHGCVISMS